jgi:WD40 repeat protein
MRGSLRWLLAVAVLIVVGTARAEELKQGWLGVELQELSKEEALKLGWKTPHGAKVVHPLAASPAEAAGLKPGDVITTLDGAEVEGPNALTTAVIAKGAGAQVTMGVIRAGSSRTTTTVKATLGARPGALAAGIENGPQLMLDTGGHMATISGLAVTPDGKQLVSASNDKTVRVWDLATGKTIRIIRGESAPGNWGTIYAMALSPDARWLAVSGYMHGNDRAVASAVRLYDFANGKLVALLKGHTQVVFALAFSPDGKRLISGSGDTTAIVWDLATRRQVLRLSGHTKAVKAVAFTNDGRRVVTGSSDETLRLWNAADGKLIAEMTEHKEASRREAQQHAAMTKQEFKESDVWYAGVTAVAVSRGGPLIASGSADGRMLLWDGRTGKFLRKLAFPGGARGLADIHSLSFSPDGRWVLSTNLDGGCAITEVATGRDLYDGKLRNEASLSGNKEEFVPCIGATAFRPDGRLAAAGYNSVIRLLDANTRKPVRTLESSGVPVHGVAFADEGRSILWGSQTGHTADLKQVVRLTRRLQLPLGGRMFGAVEAAAVDKMYYPGHGEAMQAPYSVSFKRGDSQLTINVQHLEVFKDGQVQSEINLSDVGSLSGDAPIQFTPDGQAVLVGMTPEIRAYDLHGQLLGTYVGHFGQVRDLAVSPDGRLLLSGGSDQTVRLWNLKTRELIVTLYYGGDGEWVMWTPQGYYMGSPGADKIVGWQINRGPEQAPDYVGAEQLRQHLNRPDIVARAIEVGSAEEAVREAPGTSFKLSDLLAHPVPAFKILSPSAGSRQHAGRAHVTIAIEPTPDPVKLIRVQVNGREVDEQTPEVGSGGFGAGERVLDVPLANGSNEVRISLTNEIGESVAALALSDDGEGDLDIRGTLHILAIGVNDYKALGTMCGGSCDLRFSVADARALADAVEKRLGPSHTKVVKRLLVNGGAIEDAPTASNIMDAVELLRQTKENDTVVLFIAGHGVNDGPDYRFVPTDAEWIGGALRGSRVVPWQVLQSAIEAAKGRRLLFVDTCHASNAYNQRLGNAAYHANIIAYTATRFDQEALEDERLGHGLFTYAVVEGLEGKGHVGARRQISTRDLASYVVERVGELAKALNRQQEPQYFRGLDADDYLLAR